MNKENLESYILSVVAENSYGFFVKGFIKALKGDPKTRITLRRRDFFGKLNDYSISEIESVVNEMISKKLLITEEYKNKLKIYAEKQVKKEPLETIIELIDKGSNIFITGGGGVGKSYILHKLKDHYKDDLNITSTTGISAFNVGGQTIHSWAGINPKRLNESFEKAVRHVNSKSTLKKQITKCKILAIDEVSMMSDKLIKFLDDLLQGVRKNHKPFGGIQVILIGDFFQLPPIKKDDPNADFCFTSGTWNNLKLITIYLKEVKRQSDKKYIDALNNIRTGILTKEDQKIFYEDKRNYDKSHIFDKNILQIYGKNEPAEEYNKKCFSELKANEIIHPATDTLYQYDNEDRQIAITINDNNNSQITDEDKECIQEFNKDCKAPKKLHLKEGCRVMLLRNLNLKKGLVNGACGKVTLNTNTQVKVLFDNGIECKIEPVKFEYILENKIKIKRKQYPLRLAYAITVHKSQGMTFDKLVIDFDSLFCDGMAYVALSRTKSLDGLYIRDFNPSKISTANKVKNFYKDLENSPRCIILGDNNEQKNILEDDDLIKIEDSQINTNDYEKDNTESTTEVSQPDNSIQHNEIITKSLDEIKAEIRAEIKAEMESEMEVRIKKAVSEALSQKNNNQNSLDDKTIEEIQNDEQSIESSDNNSSDFILGFAKYQEQKYDEALELFNNYIIENPNNEKAYYYRGCIYKIKEDYKTAITNYTMAIKLKPKTPSYINTRANVFYDNKHYKKAIRDWKKVLKLDPEYEIDYFNKGYAEHEVENYEQAVEDYTKYLENNPDDSSAYNNRGLAKECSENYSYEDILTDYSKAIELDKNEPLYLENRANVFYDSKQYDKAIQDWEKVLKLDPEYEISYFRKGYAEHEVENYEQAVEDYTKYLENNPDNSSSYNNRGLAKECSKNYSYEDILTDYSKAIELDKNEPLYLKNRANVFYDSKQYDKAIQDWEKVLKLDPEYEINYFRKGYAEHEVGNYEQAIKDYTKYLENNPDNSSSYNNRGLAKNYSGSYSYEDILVDYSQAIKLDKNEPLYLKNRANLFYDNKQYDKAIKDWKKVLKLEIDEETRQEINNKINKTHEILFTKENKQNDEKEINKKINKAGELIKKGYTCCKNPIIALDYLMEANKILEEIIEKDSKNTEAYFLLGNVYYLFSEYAYAQKNYEKVLELDKNHAKAHLNLGTVKENRGCYQEARYYYKKAMELDASLKVQAEKNIKNVEELML